MLVQDGFPDWVVQLIEAQGIDGALASLSWFANNADTDAAKTTYNSYLQRLNDWNTTVPLQPSTSDPLTEPVPLPDPPDDGA